MPALSHVFLGATYAFAAALQPGQFQAYLISQALRSGWRRTLPAALAPIFSDIPVIALVLLVLTQVPPGFVRLLQVVGGLFLLYLASRAVLAAGRMNDRAGSPPEQPHRTVMKAVMVNLLNPNPYLAWALVLGPSLVRAWREAPSHGLAFLFSFYATMVLATAAIIVLFSAARSVGRHVTQALGLVSAAALAGFGLYQLWSAWTA